jgi:hypothetical protein
MKTKLNHCFFCLIPFSSTTIMILFLNFIFYGMWLHLWWMTSTVYNLHSIGRFYGSRGRDESRSNNDGFRARSRSPGKPVEVSNWWLHPLGAIQFLRWWRNQVKDGTSTSYIFLLSCLNLRMSWNITNLGYGWWSDPNGQWSPTFLIWRLRDAWFHTICLWL